MKKKKKKYDSIDGKDKLEIYSLHIRQENVFTKKKQLCNKRLPCLFGRSTSLCEFIVDKSGYLLRLTF